VIVSLNEIETTVRKAALGVGLPLGIAEEAGLAAAWAATLPIAIETLISEALANIDEKRVARPCFTLANGLCRADGGTTSALWLGPTATDIACGETLCRLACEAVDIPFLAAAIVARACEGNSQASAVVAWNTCRLIITKGACSILAPSATALCARGRGLNLRHESKPESWGVLFATADLQQLKSQALRDGIGVDSPAWSHVQRYANRTLVPATERSRLIGAGAGDIDRV
jgi:hypothetical protein